MSSAAFVDFGQVIGIGFLRRMSPQERDEILYSLDVLQQAQAMWLQVLRLRSREEDGRREIEMYRSPSLAHGSKLPLRITEFEEGTEGGHPYIQFECFDVMLRFYYQNSGPQLLRAW